MSVEFKRGDVVQCICAEVMPSQPGSKSFAETFYDLPSVPHPHYAMIGIVCRTAGDSIAVWCVGSWLEPDQHTRLPGRILAFSPAELVKIGDTNLQLPYDKINMQTQIVGTEVVEEFNKQYGTNFRTMEEFKNHFRIGGSESEGNRG